jgi:apolipoprotein N-acyltransferase
VAAAKQSAAQLRPPPVPAKQAAARKRAASDRTSQPPTQPRALLPPLWREAAEVLGLYGLSVLLFTLIFPPGGIWPLAFVCLAPWAVATCRTRRAWLVHWSSFIFGIAFFLINLRWLMPVTGLGYGALCFYLAIYWTLAAWALRTAQRHGISPLWTLPVAWVACEYLRACVMTGFPWLFLAHAFYEQIWFIQISDLVGAYGVSFLAALVNGALAALVLELWRPDELQPRKGQLYAGAAVTLGLLAFTLIYGGYRANQQDFADGPRVAVIQQDFTLSSQPPYSQAPSWVIFGEYLRLAAEAAAHHPDIVAFPETVWSATQNIEFLSVEHNVIPGWPTEIWTYSKLCHEAVSAFARGDYAAVNARLDDFERRYPGKLPRLPGRSGPPVTVLLGATSVETFPGSAYPGMKRYNSALVYDPDGTQRPVRYDKRHLVPFGEVVPFRYGRLHFLYRWLNKLSPFSNGGENEYTLDPGSELTVFKLDRDGQTSRFGTPICYEDVMPYLIRDYVWEGGRRRVDFLINISNDAWFLHANELPQHLAICAFRAVEDRVGIARAVNTGISAFIDPNGRITAAVEKDGRRFGPGIIGYLVEPVKIDTRGSFYGRTGDWFAGVCLLLTVVLWVVAVMERWVLALRLRISEWRARRAGGVRTDGVSQ